MDLIIGHTTSETSRIQKNAKEDGSANTNHLRPTVFGSMSTELRTPMSLAAEDQTQSTPIQVFREPLRPLNQFPG